MAGSERRNVETDVLSANAAISRQDLLRTLIDTLPDIVFTQDTAGRFVICNPALLHLVGFTREDELAGKTVFELFPREMAEAYHADDLQVLSGQSVFNREEQCVDSEGNLRWHLTIKVPQRDEAGQIVGLIGISRNITDRKRLTLERIEALARLQLQIARMPFAYVLLDAELRITDWNPAAALIFGYSKAEVLGMSPPFEKIIPASFWYPHGEELARRIRAGDMSAHTTSPHLTKDGRKITCEWTNTPLLADDGQFTGLMCLGTDVTEQKSLEQQLHQVQKLEAIGTLAGGVAHDFNNLLTVISGYSEMILDGLHRDDPLHEPIEEIKKAGERAESLTRQLLAFSRRQVLKPVVLDLNALLADMEKMLRRLLGEDVDFQTRPDSELWTVLADPGQLEQVLMNLTVNARDAMPQGGKLTIETANVELNDAYVSTHAEAHAGPHVLLSVRDRGCGMDAATLSQIFEPFFTTKGLHKGTGLGLATVYGIVKQSGGHIDVESQTGFGSTFKIFLPRSAQATVANLDRQESQRAPRGHETILLVEDEEGVRSVAKRILQRTGYHVLEAKDGEEALKRCQQSRLPLDLLITDVVMPQMSGRQLAERLRQLQPGLKVLYTSGYTDDAILRHGVLTSSTPFLQKPLKTAALTQMVRELLDDDGT